MAWARGRLQSLIQNVDASISLEKGTAKVVGMKELTGDVRLALTNACKTILDLRNLILEDLWGLSYLRQQLNFLNAFTFTIVFPMQAYLTRRKGNKTLIVYDLELTLQWQGRLAGEESDVSCMK